jgi:hypothetical protein
VSIFGKIKDAIFGHAAQAAPAATSSVSAAAPSAAPSSAQSGAAPSQPVAPAVSTASSATSAQSSATSQIDIGPALDAAVKKSGQKLDWRHSIVDLMKAVGMDASLAERKELAGELGYTGDQNDSAKMNMYLHKALMKKLSENGGNVPTELLD